MNKILSKCIKEFLEIDSYKEIRSQRMTFAEYNTLGWILNDIRNGNGKGETVLQTVADWCKKNGLDVKQKGIVWVISVPENDE